MGAVIGAAFQALILSLGRLFLSWKVFGAFLITGILGIVLYNLVAEILGEVLTFIQGQINAATGELGASAPLQLSGIGAWLAQVLKLPEQISVALTFVGLKWMVVKIPFLKW